jgi:hypothetical protein
LPADAFAPKANLTLNTGPLPDGSIHPSAVGWGKTAKKDSPDSRHTGCPSGALYLPSLGLAIGIVIKMRGTLEGPTHRAGKRPGKTPDPQEVLDTGGTAF